MRVLQLQCASQSSRLSCPRSFCIECVCASVWRVCVACVSCRFCLAHLIALHLCFMCCMCCMCCMWCCLPPTTHKVCEQHFCQSLLHFSPVATKLNRRESQSVCCKWQPGGGGRFGGFVASTDSVARQNSSIDFVGGERGACSNGRSCSNN